MEAITTITGNVGGDVDHKVVTDQATVATFRLACTPRLFRAGSWTDGTTTWITVQCWRALADNVANSLKKGDPVIVTGRLRSQNWTTEEGVNRERMVIEASSVGHDLTRGITNFVKRVRAFSDEDRTDPVAPDDMSEEDAELVTADA